MLRNDKIIRLIKEKLSRKEESNTFSNYPRANYNDHESDDDESSDESSDDGELIHDRLFKNISERVKSERKSVYLRGLCKLNTNYPEYTIASILCYQIKHINGFPVLLFKLHKLIKIFSAATFDIPYGSIGIVSISSVKGVFCEPYLAIDEQNTILFTLLEMPAEKTATEACKLFFVISWGENTDKPS